MPFPFDEVLTWFAAMAILFANRKLIDMCWLKMPGVSNEFKNNFTGVITIVLVILGFGYLLGDGYSINVSIFLKLFVYFNGILAVYALYLVSKIQDKE